MVAAAIAAYSSQDKDSLTSQEYRDFKFLFATTILHELSHIFLTYLTKGNELTPPSMRAFATTTAPTRAGESGHLMEQLVFGGQISFFRDHVVGSLDTSVCSSIAPWVYSQFLRSKLTYAQSGVPYIRTTTGMYQVRRETIDNTVNGGM